MTGLVAGRQSRRAVRTGLLPKRSRSRRHLVVIGPIKDHGTHWHWCFAVIANVKPSGRGYSNGLRGAEINDIARLTTIVDI